MESSETPESTAHGIDLGTFIKYGLLRSLSGLFEVASLLMFTNFNFFTLHLQVDFWVWMLFAAILLHATYSLFGSVISLFLILRSTVLTSPGCVIYFRRVWRPLSGVCYIAYRIDHITKQKGPDNQVPSMIKGNNQAFYLDGYGQPVDAPRPCGKVKLPPVFSNAEEICRTLDKIEDAAGEAAGRREGFPWRLEGPKGAYSQEMKR